MCPVLDQDAVISLPQGSHDLGNGFVLLQPRMHYTGLLEEQEQIAVSYVVDDLTKLRKKWGRLCLPNGQVARSYFQNKDGPPKAKEILIT